MLIGFNYIIKTSYDYSFDYSVLLFPLLNLLLNLMASFFSYNCPPACFNSILKCIIWEFSRWSHFKGEGKWKWESFVAFVSTDVRKVVDEPRKAEWCDAGDDPRAVRWAGIWHKSGCIWRCRGIPAIPSHSSSSLSANHSFHTLVNIIVTEFHSLPVAVHGKVEGKKLVDVCSLSAALFWCTIPTNFPLLPFANRVWHPFSDRILRLSFLKFYQRWHLS